MPVCGIEIREDAWRIISSPHHFLLAWLATVTLADSAARRLNGPGRRTPWHPGTETLLKFQACGTFACQEASEARSLPDGLNRLKAVRKLRLTLSYSELTVKASGGRAAEESAEKFTALSRQATPRPGRGRVAAPAAPGPAGRSRCPEAAIRSAGACPAPGGGCPWPTTGILPRRQARESEAVSRRLRPRGRSDRTVTGCTE